MMIDTDLLLGVALGAAIGSPIGYFLGFQRKHTDDGSILVPVIDHRPLGQRLREANPRQILAWVASRWLMVVMVVVLIAGFVQQQAITYTQRECNDRLWSTIAARGAIADDTEQARKDNDKAVYDLFTSWLALVPNGTGNNRDQAITALRKFEQTYSENLAQQEANAGKRAATPIPKC